MAGNEMPSLEFDLGETADMLRRAVRAFAEDEIAPRAADIDRNNDFPADLWRKMGDLGVLGVTVDEAHGGAGMGYLEHVVAMEEISRASASVGLSLRRPQQSLRQPDFSQRQRLPKACLPAAPDQWGACRRAGHERAWRGI